MSDQNTISSQANQSKGMSIAGMVLGIVGLLFSFTCLFWLSIILGIVGVSLSAIGMKNAEQEARSMAIAGLTTSIIALVISVIWMIIWYAFFAVANVATDAVIEGAFDSLDNYDWEREYDKAMDDWEREYDKVMDEFEKSLDSYDNYDYYSY